MPPEPTHSSSTGGVADSDPHVVSEAASPPHGFNPLRYEEDAFKVLLYFVGTVAVIVVLVLVIKAIA